jgi:hypothetical protein
MLYFRVFFIVFLLFSSLPSLAASMGEPEKVEEPDASDNAEIEEPKSKDIVIPVPNKEPEQKAGEVETRFNTVILLALNKVTARSQTIKAPIGNVMRFGTIEIVAHNCWKSAQEDRPENAALLEISEIKQGEPPTQIFLGWMFSSSPAVSSLEHPFYDVTVVACENTKE